MTLLDYIFLGSLALAMIIGLWKGFIKQVFALVGVFVIAIGTTYIAPVVDGWLVSLIEKDITRSIVAMIATFIVLSVAYGIITGFISKTVNKVPVLGGINRALGALLAIAVVYMIFSVLVALLVGTADDFLAGIKRLVGSSFEDSWIVNVVYGGKTNPERNFFGNWLIRTLAEKLQSILPQT